VTMRLSSTVMEIWPFEVLPGRLFQEQRSVVGWSVLNIRLHRSYILLFATLETQHARSKNWMNFRQSNRNVNKAQFLI